MSEASEKQRTSMSLPKEIIDAIDEFEEENHLDHRSKATEILVRRGLEAERNESTSKDDENEGGLVSRVFGQSTAAGLSLDAAQVVLNLLQILLLVVVVNLL